MGSAVNRSDSGLSSAVNVNVGYNSYSTYAFLACARVLTSGPLISALLGMFRPPLNIPRCERVDLQLTNPRVYIGLPS
jgi:hypothetical protein